MRPNEHPPKTAGLTSKLTAPWTEKGSFRQAGDLMPSSLLTPTNQVTPSLETRGEAGTEAQGVTTKVLPCRTSGCLEKLTSQGCRRAGVT